MIHAQRRSSKPLTSEEQRPLLGAGGYSGYLVRDESRQYYKLQNGIPLSDTIKLALALLGLALFLLWSFTGDVDPSTSPKPETRTIAEDVSGESTKIINLPAIPNVAARIVEHSSGGAKSLLSELTILIKSHERHQCLILLLQSIRQFYPDIRIIVVDDSHIPPVLPPALNSDRHIQLYSLPYDSGLSTSRNYGVDRVETLYTAYVDDDFVFTEHTRLENLLAVVSDPRVNVDLAAGSLYLNTSKPDDFYDYSGNFEVRTSDQALVLRNGDRGAVDGYGPDTVYGCRRVDIVANFFVALTAVLQTVRWDDELKLGEHQDFFWRAKEMGVRVAACPRAARVWHKQDHTDPNYVAKREREVYYLRRFLEKHGFSSLVAFSGATYVKR